MIGEQGSEDYEAFVGVGRADADAAGSALERAFEDAYENGKKATGKTSFRVVEIEFSGSNPINEYRVVVRPRG